VPHCSDSPEDAAEHRSISYQHSSDSRAVGLATTKRDSVDVCWLSVHLSVSLSVCQSDYAYVIVLKSLDIVITSCDIAAYPRNVLDIRRSEECLRCIGIFRQI